MTDKIKEQILAVRASGKTNMFDVYAVQKIAYDSGFYDLVNFIEESKAAYIAFIMTGKTEK